MSSMMVTMTTTKRVMLKFEPRGVGLEGDCFVSVLCRCYQKQTSCDVSAADAESHSVLHVVMVKSSPCLEGYRCEDWTLVSCVFHRF